MTAQNGTGNPFPPGQCTRYASDRYHTLAGFYVPWLGNAKDWVTNAPGYEWTVSDQPTFPSIICLQPGVQGADPHFGHVGVAEGGTATAVQTTDLNWGTTPTEKATVQTVTFQTGTGVKFISATPGSSPSGQTVNITLEQYMQSILTQLRNNAGVSNAFGAGPSQNIINFMIAWGRQEGGSQTNACHFNVLNTMQDESGATQCPGTLPGIKSYPDSATGEKGQIDALQNGNYKSLLQALVNNDELNLGFTQRGAPSFAHQMSNAIASDLSVWVHGTRNVIGAQSYILAIMQNAGISNAVIEGGTAQGGKGATQTEITTWGQTVIGQGVVQSNNPLDAFSSINSFFGGLNNLMSDPTRLIKGALGLVLIITGLVLLVRQVSPSIIKAVA